MLYTVSNRDRDNQCSEKLALQAVFDSIVMTGKEVDATGILEGAGWQPATPPPLHRLLRRLQINRLNTVIGILTRSGYAAIFRYFWRSRIHSKVRDVNYHNFGDGSKPKMTLTAWFSAELPGVLVVVTQTCPKAKRGGDSLTAIWAFSPHYYEDRKYDDRYSDNLIDPDKYATTFNGTGRNCTTPGGNYNGTNHVWQRNSNDSPYRVGQINKHYISDQFRLRFEIRGFVGSLLPGFELPDHATVYSAERSQLFR